MNYGNVLKKESEKPMEVFIERLNERLEKQGFVIHNREKMNLAKTFGAHGVPIKNGFDLHMIQVCKPAKAAQSLTGNPERAILMPKFIIVFSQDNKTQVRYFSYGKSLIESMVVDDEFPESLAASNQSIRTIIEESI